MQNYYQILGVAPDASEQVIRIAVEGRLKALDDPRFPLSPEQRREEERSLREILVTLTVDAKRAVYDAKLYDPEAFAPVRARGQNTGLIFVAVMVAVVVLGFGAFAVERSRDREQARLEAERLTIERERLAHESEMDRLRAAEQREREDSAERARQARTLNTQSARERDDIERWRRTTDSNLREQQSTSGYSREYEQDRINNEVMMQEIRERREEQARQYRARAEVERQKQYLRQREQEEERARLERHYRAQAESREVQRREAQEARRSNY